MSLDLNLSSNPITTFYLKGAFKKSESSNYFGHTKVGSSWIKNGSPYQDQYKITTDSSGKWSGIIEVQPDVLDSGYEGSGDYIFKVGRYTSSGSGPTWSNESNIKISAQEVVADNVEVVNSSNISKKSSKEILGEESVKDLPESVYSLENYRRITSDFATPQATKTSELKKQNRNLILPIIGGVFIGFGIGLGIYLFIKKRVKE